MDKKIRNTIIGGVIISFIIVPAVTIFTLSIVNPKPTEVDTTPDRKITVSNRSNDELSAAIVDQQSSLVSDGQPIFAIVKVDKPQTSWYIVTIRGLEDTEASNPAKVLLQDNGSEIGLKVLLGPGTQFPSDVTQPLGIPDPVVEELNNGN
jgi:hypothetical protein